MGTFELILILIAAVLLSALLSQLTSKISTPLIQIFLGVIIALFISIPVKPDMSPDMFMLLFIAPLLFNEAMNIDKLGFWKNKWMILSLAIGLIIVTMLAVGYATCALVPSVALAAALALGAALGPTDAVAVSSMSRTAALSDKQKSILNGESLINDATGLVAFQFAIAAAVTGTFSMSDAGTMFVVEFIGGIVLGVVIGWLLNRFMDFVRYIGLENRTFHVLLEVAIPFATYMLGSTIGVSGILAVVACGIVFSSSHGQVGITAARTSIASSSFWDVLTFALNGIVFVLLGMMLPGGMMMELEDGAPSVNVSLLCAAGILTVIVIGARFIWTLLMERAFGSADEIDKGLVKHSAILAFGGAKGAISLTIMMTIPTAVAGRDDMIFIASVVILATLLLANFVLPVLAPVKSDDDATRKLNDAKAYIRILRRVIEHLTNDAEASASSAEQMAYQKVIGEYSQRIVKMQERNDIEDESLASLRADAIDWQIKYAQELGESGKFDSKTVHKLSSRLMKASERMRAGKAPRRQNGAKRVASAFAKSFSGSRGGTGEQSDYDKLRLKCKTYALGRLAECCNDDNDVDKDALARVIDEYRKAIIDIQATAPSVTALIKSADIADSIRLTGLSYEREFIDDAYSANEVSRKSANKMRRRVSAMALDASDEI